MRRLQMMTEEEVKYLVIHCSATRCDRDYTEEMLLRDHLARHFRGIGYHFYIRKDGKKTQHRMLLEVGAHCIPYNKCSIGICYEGGLDEHGKPANTLTKSRRSESLICSSICTSSFRKRRLWGIVTCRVPHLRNVLVLIPMPYSGG